MGLDEKAPFVDCESCALCNIYLDTSIFESDDDCLGCPVFENTSRRQCKGAPYYRYVESVEEFSDYPDRAGLRKAINAAKAEVKFLKSLSS